MRVTIAFTSSREPLTFGNAWHCTHFASNVLREPSIPQHLVIGPKSSAGVDVTASGTAIGGNAAAAEPVNVRAIAYIDSPTGAEASNSGRCSTLAAM